MRTVIRVGGVPEHFNLPWHLAVESGAFEAAGLEVLFDEYPTGTGALCADLRAGRLDLVVALTEGLLLDMVREPGDTLLLAPYVLSPLCWGIHVGAKSDLITSEQLRDGRLAISRAGSGSHLMALLWAHQQGWTPESLSLDAVGGLNQLEAAVCEGPQQAFLWELFTTLPRVKAGTLRRIDTIDTPWPCFMIACRQDWLATHQPAAVELLRVLFAQTQLAMQQTEQTIAAVSARYHLTLTEAREWFQSVRWATAAAVDMQVLQQTLHTLCTLGLLTPEQLPADPAQLTARLSEGLHLQR